MLLICLVLNIVMSHMLNLHQLCKLNMRPFQFGTNLFYVKKKNWGQLFLKIYLPQNISIKNVLMRISSQIMKLSNKWQMRWLSHFPWATWIMSRNSRNGWASQLVNTQRSLVMTSSWKKNSITKMSKFLVVLVTLIQFVCWYILTKIRKARKD